MKVPLVVFALAIAFGVAYGVLFSLTYPQVQIYLGLAALFGLLGLLTAIALVALFQSISRRRKRNAGQP
jgi:hypothetical protein